MFSLTITRWMMGYVRFSIRGGSPERFLTNCARSGAYLWDIAPGPNHAACIEVRGYRGLRRNARRAGCRLKVRERRGLPFLLRRTYGHMGLWVGMAVFAVILVQLSLRIWCVQISGNENIPSSEIRAALSEAGLNPGTLKRSIQPESLAQSIMLKIPDIGWMSVNTEGNIVEVCVEDKTKQPDIVDQQSICNIKASFTGQILDMHVYAGTALVQKGDAVIQGQLLVSAVVEDKTGGSTLKHATAQIIAATKRTLETRVDRVQTKFQPTGKTAVRRSLGLFGVSLPLSVNTRPKGEWQLSASRTRLQLFDTLLPVDLYEEDWQEMRAVSTTLSDEEARALAKEQIDQMVAQMQGVAVTQMQMEEKWEDSVLHVTANLSCQENIAEESEILIK